MSPQWPNLVLSSDVPNVELHILVRHSLDVEAHGGDGSDGLIEFEFIQDRYWRVSISGCCMEGRLEGVADLFFQQRLVPTSVDASLSTRTSSPKAESMLVSISRMSCITVGQGMHYHYL